ncbi:hypothetical protein CB1_000820010 [Camelus ferus]|nr:hypothetical protein CB1_000820010 [Camelus ferus]
MRLPLLPQPFSGGWFSIVVQVPTAVAFSCSGDKGLVPHPPRSVLSAAAALSLQPALSLLSSVPTGMSPGIRSRASWGSCGPRALSSRILAISESSQGCRLPGAQEGAAHAGGPDHVPRCSEEERKTLELMKALLAPTIVPTPLEERLRGRSFKAE